MQWEGFDDHTIDRFRGYQAQSFDIQQAVKASLTEGMTERDVGKQMMQAYREAGVESFFHLPVTLFGSRTTLPDPWNIQAFWPTDTKLHPGDSVILDASPIFDGLLVDTSTSFHFGPAPDGYAEAARDDVAYRQTILEAVQSGATFREIARAVDQQFGHAGYRNCHRLHPGEVLGHRVGDVSDAAAPNHQHFAADLVTWFFSQLANTDNPIVPAPTWADGPGSDHPPADGLWAVEPHLGIGGIGVKWEEILVINGSEMYWLQDNPPHTQGFVGAIS